MYFLSENIYIPIQGKRIKQKQFIFQIRRSRRRRTADEIIEKIPVSRCALRRGRQGASGRAHSITATFRRGLLIFKIQNKSSKFPIAYAVIERIFNSGQTDRRQGQDDRVQGRDFRDDLESRQRGDCPARHAAARGSAASFDGEARRESQPGRGGRRHRNFAALQGSSCEFLPLRLHLCSLENRFPP